MSTARAKDAAMVAFGILVIVVDQLTKHWVQDYFTAHPYTVIPIVGNILSLMYLQNTGVAFSLFTGQALLYVLIAIAVCVIGYLYWRTRETASLLLKVSFGLVLGGAVGNLIDRFTHQYVVDFIHFQIPAIHFDFPVFNVADSAVSVGVVLLAWMLWTGGTGIEEAETPTPPSDATEQADSTKVISAKGTGDS